MAFVTDSTPAPARQRGLLPLAANRREIPGSCPAAQPLTGVVSPHDTLATIEAELAAFVAQPWPMSAPENTAGRPCTNDDLWPGETLAGRPVEALLPAAEARALHSRRRLGEALEYGFALLDALDLPPLALDVIDSAIAALDALDAPDEDKEPWLAGGWDPSCAPYDGELEPEHDEDDGTAEAEPDGEPSLGWPNDFRAQLDPSRNWEADYDREATNEDGSDDGREEPGWFAGEFDVPQVMRGMMEDARRRPAVLHG